MQKLSLQARGRELLERAADNPAGRTAETVVGGHERVLRQTMLAMVAGSALGEHANPGEGSLYVLRGRVRLMADGQSWEGRDGDLLILPDSDHGLEAVEDSAVLLTVAKRP